VCGRPLWLANAKKKFCSDRCRQANLRSRTQDRKFALSRSVGHHPSGLSRFAKKSPLISAAYKAYFRSRGIVGPGHVIEIETGLPDPTKPDDPTFQAMVNALIATIPDDLGIPNSLRRRP
jgi:hypothetical protein